MAHIKQENARILADYFLNSYLKQNHANDFYLNGMSNDRAYGSKITDGSDDSILMREEHNYCNFSVISFFQDQNGYKLFNSREYFYITGIVNNVVTLRFDLVKKWAENNAKDYVLAISETKAVKIGMQTIIHLFNSNTFNSYRNEELNILLEFDISKFQYFYRTDDNSDRLKAFTDKIVSQWSFIGHIKYAEYRHNGKCGVKAIVYENGTKTKTLTYKNSRELYEILVEKGFNKNIRTLRRYISNFGKITFGNITIIVTDKIDFEGKNTL